MSCKDAVLSVINSSGTPVNTTVTNLASLTYTTAPASITLTCQAPAAVTLTLATAPAGL